MLRKSPLLLPLAIALVLPANQAVQAAGEPTPAAMAAADRRVHIVVFEEPAVADFRGFTGTDKQRPPLRATAASATGARRLDPRSEAVVAYRDYLGDLRRVRLNDAAARLGRPLQPQFVYDFALNGLALELTAAEAAALAAQPGVKRVQPEFVHRPLTDRGPAWIKAPQVWDGTGTGGSIALGAGVVVGVIDTGIRASHASFSALSAVDGYVHVNPRGTFYGNAGTGSTATPKNGKLIGIWDFTTGTGDAEANDGGDVDGHGTHVASTAVGNPVDFSAGTYSARMSGVAPRAHLVSYKACELEADCRGAWTLAAINQAIADQVDVVNYSIGGPAYDPWSAFGTAPVDDSAEAMLAARSAGIVVVVAAGNDGPQPGTHGSPANAPWVLSVAAASHDRAVTNSLAALSGGAGAAPGGGSLVGSGNTNLGTGTGIVPIVRDPDYPYCASGASQGTVPPSGVTRPPTWNAGTFAGKIVACERATVISPGYARVEMAYNVQQAGGVGMVLLNQDSDGLSTVADSYVIPMVHLSASDSAALRSWLASGSGHQGQLQGAATRTDASFGDRLASFSGRGPVVPVGVLKPNLAAPGVSIYAAGNTADNAVAVKSGTSMASPHVAGAAALLLSLYPERTVNQVMSALSLTARPSVRLPSGEVAAPHDQGAGTVDLALASRAGLYLDPTQAQFQAASADASGNIALPSYVVPHCFDTCSQFRILKRMPGISAATYNVQVHMPEGTSGTPNPVTLTTNHLGAALTINFNVAARAGQWVYGRVDLVDASGSGHPTLSLPIAVYSEAFFQGTPPAAIARQVVAERGHFDVDLADLVAMPDARFVASDLVEPVVRSQLVGQDTTFDPYDGLDLVDINARNVYFTGTVPASGPEGAVDYRIQASIASAAADLQLFVGLDGNGNGRPALGEELCRSTGPTSAEQCAFTVRSGAAPRSYWVLVQGYQVGSTPQTVTAEASAVPMGPALRRTLVATGPGMLSSREAFKLRLAYDDPGLLAGQRRVGSVAVQTGSGHTIAHLPVSLTRSGAGFAPFALADNVGRTIMLPAGGAQDRLFFDVPPHAAQVSFRTQSAANIDLYVARVAGDAGGSDSNIAAAPPRAQADAFVATAGGNESLVIGGDQLSAGRWYVTPVNSSGIAAEVTVTAQVTVSGARPRFRAGHYFSPARSGHGAFIDFAGPQDAPDQWLIVWYTYLEDGTPTWYYAQGASPGPAGIFRADLMRVVWNGEATRATDVGDLSLTELDIESIGFSYNLDGTSGSEVMQRLGAGGGCRVWDGVGLDLSGHWFSPSLTGFGYSYQITVGSNPQEILIPYVYDAQGFPRWAYAQRRFDGSTAPMALQTFQGFCPTCTPAALVSTAAGNATRTIANGNILHMSAAIPFSPPLAGAWNQSRPVSRLSQPTGCW